MKKFIILSLLLAASTMVGCYNDFDTPAPAYVYSDSDFSDCEIISIKSLKEDYASLVCSYGNSVIEEDLVIRGKVVSTDEEGSIYKSLYILDHHTEGSAAIELRLFASNYVSYPVGSMIYVRLNGLSIGDYGGMLSIGASSVDPDYAHTTIEGKVMLAEHIFVGERLEMTSADTLVVNSSNYTTVDLSEALGRLVRFEGVESAYGTPKWTSYAYPSYFSSSSNNFEWEDIPSSSDVLNPPTLAYYGANPVSGDSSLERYYGSGWLTYDRTSERDANDAIAPGHYITRISGYAYFRETELPADGAIINLTAILTQYGSSAYWLTYQLNMNHGSDLEVISE